MLKGLITSARSFLSLVMSLILVVFLSWLAWGCWRLYENEKELQQFIKEGEPVTVQVTATDRQNLTWYDQFSNKAYITFNYHNQPYTVRYIQDSGWVSTGDRLTLLYHPQLNTFRQASKQIHFKARSAQSRLLQFSFTSMWSDERKWLVLTWLLIITITLIALGLLSNILQLPILQQVGKFILTALVVGGALYFTYNGWQYNRYYSKIKDHSQQSTVTVLSTDYHRRSRRSDWGYTYDARVQFGNEQKVIPIEEEDYEKLKPNDPLTVLYNSELNDMMPVNYTPDRSNIWMSLFFWVLAIFFVRQNYFKRKSA